MQPHRCAAAREAGTFVATVSVVQLKTPRVPIARDVVPSTVSVNWFVFVSRTPLCSKSHARS
jgi:hypothetical protein